MSHQFLTHLNFFETFHIRDVHRAQTIFIQMTAALGVNIQINETFEITVGLKNTSEAADFITQILSLLAYGGSFIMETKN